MSRDGKLIRTLPHSRWVDEDEQDAAEEIDMPDPSGMGGMGGGMGGMGGMDQVCFKELP